MAETTGIEWADRTWSPWVGCQRVSPACDHCYAEAWAKRSGLVQWGPHAERRRTSDDYWKRPHAWNRQAAREGRSLRVFPSLCDPFDNQVPEEWREDFWALIHDTPQLDWLLLTKRPQNIARMLPPGWMQDEPWPWPNVWLGTTAENQAEADRRIPHLLAVPAAVRFLSCEPLLGPIEIVSSLSCECHDAVNDFTRRSDGIHWIIAGGESGPGARPSHPDWFRSLRDQCAAFGVPYFHKQNGEWAVYYDRDREDPDWRRCPRADRRGELYLNLAGGQGFHGDRVVAMRRVGKARAGAMLDGREHREFPHA